MDKNTLKFIVTLVVYEITIISLDRLNRVYIYIANGFIYYVPLYPLRWRVHRTNKIEMYCLYTGSCIAGRYSAIYYVARGNDYGRARVSLVALYTVLCIHRHRYVCIYLQSVKRERNVGLMSRKHKITSRLDLL